MRSLLAIAISLWLGAMAFFAFFVAPAAFHTLEREAAGRFVSVVFPRYYALGTALGVVALLACVGRGVTASWPVAEWLSVGLVLLMVALTLYAWVVLLPAAHAAREAMHTAAGSAEALRFARLHRLSSMLNVVVMIAGVVLLAMEVGRRP
jgi:uncharacterized membrane protein